MEATFCTLLARVVQRGKKDWREGTTSEHIRARKRTAPPFQKVHCLHDSFSLHSTTLTPESLNDKKSKPFVLSIHLLPHPTKKIRKLKPDQFNGSESKQTLRYPQEFLSTMQLSQNINMKQKMVAVWLQAFPQRPSEWHHLYTKAEGC